MMNENLPPHNVCLWDWALLSGTALVPHTTAQMCVAVAHTFFSVRFPAIQSLAKSFLLALLTKSPQFSKVFYVKSF